MEESKTICPFCSENIKDKNIDKSLCTKCKTTFCADCFLEQDHWMCPTCRKCTIVVNLKEILD